MSQSPEKPKFSLLNAMRSQADAKKVIAAEAAKPATTGSLLGNRGVSGGTPTKSLLAPASTQKVVEESKTHEAVGSKPAEGGASVPVGESIDTKVGNANPQSGLVQANGNSLLAKLSQQKERQNEIQATHEKMFNEEPKDFRQMLDYFDSLFEKDTGINELNVAAGRDYVKIIFKQLQQDPSLDGLMLDKDIGNIIDFVRKVKGIALEAGEKKKEAKVKKDSKPAAKSRFGNIGSLQLTTAAIDSIEAISDLGDLSL